MPMSNNKSCFKHVSVLHFNAPVQPIKPNIHVNDVIVMRLSTCAVLRLCCIVMRMSTCADMYVRFDGRFCVVMEVPRRCVMGQTSAMRNECLFSGSSMPVTMCT